jgi:hypothetical protein
MFSSLEFLLISSDVLLCMGDIAFLGDDVSKIELESNQECYTYIHENLSVISPISIGSEPIFLFSFSLSYSITIDDDNTDDDS